MMNKLILKYYISNRLTCEGYNAFYINGKWKSKITTVWSTKRTVLEQFSCCQQSKILNCMLRRGNYELSVAMMKFVIYGTQRKIVIRL